VGEIVLVVEDQPVPCDILLLSSSGENGVCHVTTANLDGETSLKVVTLESRQFAIYELLTLVDTCRRYDVLVFSAKCIWVPSDCIGSELK
jgi:hypothetical protein